MFILTLHGGDPSIIKPAADWTLDAVREWILCGGGGIPNYSELVVKTLADTKSSEWICMLMALQYSMIDNAVQWCNLCDREEITKYFNSFKSSNNQISNSSKIGASSIIQPNCFIGNNVTIGENCIIHSNVSIYDNTIIGDNVIINSGTVIGGEAFYYKKRETGYDQLLSAGRVIIEDDVHIGSSTTIDRGVTGDTTIGKGSKLDNLIQIGHDTFIGECCLIASQTAVAGCVVIENNVTIWGQVGISSGVTIGESAILLAKSGVSKSLKGHTTYYGVPVSEVRTAYKEMAMIKRLPELFEKIKKFTK